MKPYVFAIIAFFSCAGLSAQACSLAPFMVDSETNGENSSHLGYQGGFSLSWKDEGEAANHVTVKNLKTDKTCELEGWPLRETEMYLSDDHSTFVLVDGIDDNIAEFYKLATCERVAQTNITAKPGQYFVSPTVVGTYGFCDGRGESDGFHCYPAAIYTLGSDCLPHYDADKSAALTKTVFGVVFTKVSHISHLGTAKATATPDADASDIPMPNVASPAPSPSTAPPPK